MPQTDKRTDVIILAGVIDDARMTELNYLVDDQGQEFEDVASTFLEEEGLAGGE